MTPFLTVNNNVSLVSITIAPSTYFITVFLLLICAVIYIPRLVAFRFPNLGIPLPSLSSLVQPLFAEPPSNTLQTVGGEKPLPEPPFARSQLVLEDQQQLVISGQDIVLAQRRHQLQQQLQLQQEQNLLLEKQRQKQIQEIEYHRRQNLDASLRDFDLPASTLSPRHSVLRSEAATEEDLEDSEVASAGGYSPPAWRRLGNGDRSSGFWRGPHDFLAAGMQRGGLSTLRESSPEFDDDSEDEMVLERAIRTKLPKGSQSPDKGRSPSPERHEDRTIQVKVEDRATPARELALQHSPPDNYIRFAVRAEVQHHTEPIEAAINFIRDRYKTLTRTWSTTFTTVLIAFFSLSPFQVSAPARLTAACGRSRQKHAVSQVHDLQATSVAVWDLGESVRTSDMRDANSIVSDLDALSETMKTLAIEMTKFFARVDGDIDGILNVMDWAKMHLNRLNSSPSPSTLSSAYDNIHNILSQARVLEDAAGSPTPLGRLTTHIFGLSNPQREQRMVQLLFTEFIAVLEDSIQAELQHSVTLFALFEAVDFHFLNLARTVVRESSAQEELHADMLSSLWTRLLGTRAAELRKFEQNRQLLRNVREKTVRNKGILVEHNGKLLTLKASLETLRSKLVSPLVRGVNSTTLTLEDQIQGLSDVSEYLGEVRKQQKGKVMETLFGSVPGKKYMIEERPDTVVVNTL
ncbi:hypothetical protein MRS44_004952 [Fusarium solani]|uniref:uncharacterized protein n=1 Tax=Fusarium solani TaxID=169388 RepID=UPI0032C3D8D3|nr:hypothetical protein MRS44_004952 [Fusarium solani]